MKESIQTANMCFTEVLKTEKGTENLVEEIMVENFPSLKKEIYPNSKSLKNSN
jgi:hypothetical protein